MFTTQLAEAARSMQGLTGTEDTVRTAVDIAVQIIEGCDLAGVSVVHKDRIDTPAASDHTLARIDALQFEIAEGPCLDALQNHETVQSDDLAIDDRWPTWGPEVVAETGVRSSVSYRLYTTQHTLGALNLYSRTVGAFDSDDVGNGLALAAHVAVALAGAQNAEHLERAIVNRTVIGQAEGILMERYDMSADQAFAVLSRVSQDSNIKLHRVAERLVRTGISPGMEGSAGVIPEQPGPRTRPQPDRRGPGHTRRVP